MKLTCWLLFIPFLLAVSESAFAALPVTKPDSLTAQPPRSAQPQSRVAPAPVIMPGTTLDTSFSTLPAQNARVGKAAPAWLRVKAIGSPMYIVNGKSATETQLRQLRQTEVVSVEVLDGTRATGLYGKNASRGLVIITTKAGLVPRQ